MTLENPNSPHAQTWWGRPSGGREVLRVAAPLVISSLSWTVMTFVDRMLLNWVSGDAMTGAFNAANFWFVLICVPLGMCSYANNFVAQYDGARQSEKIGAIVWQAIWLALAFSPLLFLAIPFAPYIFALTKHSPKVTAVEIEYFKILCVGGPAMIIAQAAAAFYSGRGQTQVVMWTDAGYALLNLVLDYLWIFGYAGFPEWGVAGAAWATVVSLWLKAFTYLWLFMQAKYRDQYGNWSGMRFDAHLFGRLVYFGGPSGLQMVLDVIGFTAFIMLVGRLGPESADATNMAFSISTLAFMPIFGLHLAVGILVGERLGENRDDLAARATITTLQVAWTYMLFISVCYVLAPSLFLFGFFPDADLTEQEQSVKHLAAVLLRFVAAYNLLDATLMVFAGAIKGAGDTPFILRVSLILAALLTSASWLAVEVFELSVVGCWVLVTLWVWIGAFVYARRFLQGKWRSMRVIEVASRGNEVPISAQEEYSRD
jgi:multidrug resistance protein, MATE family